jgi:predicted ester cyclase
MGAAITAQLSRTFTGGQYRGIVATGKRVKWTQISVVRVFHGRIVEDWAVADELGILQQMGALPT